MNNISAFRNTVKEFEIDGYKFKADQLTVFELYSKAQDEYKKFRLKDTLIIAEHLVGREKIDFLKETLKEMPTGEELAMQLQEFIESSDGVIMLLKLVISKNNPELTDNEINKIISPSTIDAFTPIYNYALSGIEDMIKPDDVDNPSAEFENLNEKDIKN